MKGFIMISMTAYWQQFKECIDKLPKGQGEYSNQLATAQHMILIGISIEQLGITEIKKVSNSLYEASKAFANKVSFKTAEKEYKFYLPKISDTESLIFSIIYYQHLYNYEQVSYEGSINWLRKFVINSVNEKKIPTRLQARAMLEEVKKYCQSHNLNINEFQLLQNKDELPAHYIARISELCRTKKDHPLENKPAAKDETQLEDLKKLEHRLEELINKKKELRSKTSLFSNKVAEFHQANLKYQTLDTEWHNKWAITKFFYWLVSFIHEPLFVKNLQEAKERCTKAEQLLNQGLAQNETVESYFNAFKKELNVINEATEQTQHQIRLLIEKTHSTHTQAEQIIDKQAKKGLLDGAGKGLDIENEIVKGTSTDKIADPRSDGSDSEVEQEKSESLPHNYGFFKEYLPDRQFIQAAAVGAAAIAIQHFVYS